MSNHSAILGMLVDNLVECLMQLSRSAFCKWGFVNNTSIRSVVLYVCGLYALKNYCRVTRTKNTMIRQMCNTKQEQRISSESLTFFPLKKFYGGLACNTSTKENEQWLVAQTSTWFYHPRTESPRMTQGALDG